MMLKSFYILIWITSLKLCFCQLKMGLGNESVFGKKYLVYFVKSPYSNSDDDTWLCAGAIVTPTQILTAAACLVEMNKIYAIAGYKKYVHARDIEKDKCANTWKKKVVMISVPKEYTTSKELEWMNVDIGVATVQEPYDFNGQSYFTHCSYVPETILINFDKNNERENTRAIALGWGGKKVKGPKKLPEETLNPKLLQEATTTIIEKTFCANLVPKNGSKEIVNKYLLCASGNGFLGEDGEETILDPLLEMQPKKGNIFLHNVTKHINQSNEISSRKSALVETCQNDHGGPLVSWVNKEEMILGVALNGICNPNFDCVGPRIYVSTAATAQIIKCLLETNNTRRKTCNDQMIDKKYEVNNIEIKWPEDVKLNSSFSLNIQQTTTVPSLRRQNEKDIIHVRPTKDLRTFNEQKDPKENPQDNPYEKLKENSRKNRQVPNQLITQPRKALQRYMNQQQIESQNPEKYSFNQPQMESQNQPQMESQNQPQMESQNQPQMESQNQPQMESQNQPQMAFQNQPQMVFQNQPEMESQNRPKITSFNQAQMESYNQPPMDPYYNQPQIDSYYNQPQMESKNLPESEPYNPPQTKSNNQPPLKPNNQKPMVPYQPQMDSFNQPHMATQNHPQRPSNKDKSNQPIHPMNNPPSPKLPQMGSLMPSPLHLYNQPQIESFQQPQADSFNEELTDQNKFSPFKKPLGKPFNNLQAESLNNSELGSLNLQQSNVDPLSQLEYSYKEPQTPYVLSKTESFETKPTEAYNPLDIIMAEDEVALKRPMEEPYMLPHAALRNHPNVEDMPQSYKPKLDKPFEQPHLSQKYQPQSPQHEQPLEQAPAQPFDADHTLNALRGRPQDRLTNPLQGASQTFEQMFSQLHAGPDPSASAPPPKEETFDEIYRNLHDEEPQDQEFGTRLEHPIEQEVEQTDTRVVKEPTLNEPQNDVQMRHQMPLEYQDYSQRRAI